MWCALYMLFIPPKNPSKDFNLVLKISVRANMVMPISAVTSPREIRIVVKLNIRKENCSSANQKIRGVKDKIGIIIQPKYFFFTRLL